MIPDRHIRDLSWAVTCKAQCSCRYSNTLEPSFSQWELSNVCSVTGNLLVFGAITLVFLVISKVTRPRSRKQAPTYLTARNQLQLPRHRQPLRKPGRRARSYYGSPAKAEVTRAI